MGDRARIHWTQAGVVLMLAEGWLIGFAVHGSQAAATGWGDIPPIVLPLGVLLCAAAGGGAWLAAPAHRRLRFGALAGLLMALSFLAGNVLVVALWVDPVHLTDGGETWFSLLLESWFWVGLPVIVSLALGALGWTAVDHLGRARHATVR